MWAMPLRCQARAIWRLREGVSDAMTTAGYVAWQKTWMGMTLLGSHRKTIPDLT